MASQQVKVYIYDLTKGMARAMSGPLLGKQLDGVWHTGVVVYGQEIFYGGMGIDRCEPGGTMLGQPDKIEVMGNTEIPYDVFMDYVIELGNTSYKGECYHLFDHNCNNFSDELSQFLTGRSIPSYITGLPQDVLSTPLGAMLRPFLDAMSMNPSGGTPINEYYHSIEPAGASEEKSEEKPAAQTNGPSEAASQKTSIITSYQESKEIQSEAAAAREGIIATLGADRAQTVNEMIEYITATNPDWGLSRGHINVIERILKEAAFNTGQKRAVAGVLQELLLKEDIVSMVSHDPTFTYCCILQLFAQQEMAVQERLAKGLYNCSTHSSSRPWLLDGKAIKVLNENTNNSQLVSSITRHCLLHTDPVLRSVGAALANSFTSDEVSEELAVDLGCAVIDLIQKDMDDETAHNAIVALCQCIGSNSEVAAIATISGLQSSDIARKHPKLTDICTQQLQPSLSKYSS